MEPVLGALFTVAVFVFTSSALGALMSKRGMPAMVGEFLIGIILGPQALGQVINLLAGEELMVMNEYLTVFYELAAIIILFIAGLEIGYVALKKTAAKALSISLPSALFPFFLTTLIFPGKTGLLLGVALAAASTIVVVKVLDEVEMPEKTEKLLLNATIVSDVLGVVALSVVVGIVEGNGGDWVSYVRQGVSIVYQLIVLILVSVAFIPGIMDYFAKNFGEKSVNSASISVAFALSAVSTILGFPPVVGAFVAGISVAESKKAAPGAEQFARNLERLFGPLFFTIAGAQIDIPSLMTPASLSLMAILITVEVVGKMVGTGVPMYMKTRRTKDAVFSGLVMMPNGEMGLIVASLGLAHGLISPGLYGALAGSVLLTLIIGPTLAVRVAE